MSVTIGFKVNGSTYSYIANGVEFVKLRLYAKETWSELSWHVPSGRLVTPDPFLGKTISLDMDCGFGLGSIRRFTGSCNESHISYSDDGWGRVYVAKGLRWAGDLIPHTDAITGMDSSAYNLEIDDQDQAYVPGRSGRTAGQILQSVLDMPENSAGLAALGIGAYTSSGYGATATATLSGGGVSGITPVTGGTGYTTGDTVYLSGNGSGATAIIATVSGLGAVLTYTVTNGGSAYTAPPEVIVSGLPLATVRDLAQMSVPMPFPVTLAGEKLLEAIEGQVRRLAPNHALWVLDRTGVIRFLDMRGFAGPVVQITDSVGSGASYTATVNSSGVVTGYVKISGGTGYVSPVVTIIGGNGSGATGTPTVVAGVITAISVGSGGSGYSRANTLTLDQFDGSGRAVLTQSISANRSVDHCFSRVKIRGQAYTQGVWVSLAPAPGASIGTNNGLVEDFAHDGLTTTQAKAAWRAIDSAIPDGTAGSATIVATLSTGAVGSLTITYPGVGYDPAHPPTAHFSGGGGTGASATMTVGASGQITGYTSLVGGSGYTTSPTIDVDMPGGGNSDTGTCTCPNSTTVIVTPIEASKIWASGNWDQTTGGKKGTIYLTATGVTGLDSKYQARIIATTARAYGGTSTLTLDTVLPALTYTAYKIVGTGRQVTWQRYKIVDSALASHMAQSFSIPQVATNSDGSAAQLVSGPFVRGYYSASGLKPFREFPIPATFDPVSGTLQTVKATPLYNGTAANLAIGGASTDGILSDLAAFLAVYKGALTAISPADTAGPTPHYSGTSNTVYGLTRTLTVTVPSWRDPGNASALAQYAADILDSVKDEALDLSFKLIGLYEEAFDFGCAVNLTGATYVTGFDAVALPVTECTINFEQGTGTKFSTELKTTSRRAHYSAENYVRPAPNGRLMNGPDEGFTGGGGYHGTIGGSDQLGGFHDQAAAQFGGFGSAADDQGGGYGSAAEDQLGGFV